MKFMCLWSGPESWLAHFKPRDDTTESQMYVVLCQLSQQAFSFDLLSARILEKSGQENGVLG